MCLDTEVYGTMKVDFSDNGKNLKLNGSGIAVQYHWLHGVGFTGQTSVA